MDLNILAMAAAALVLLPAASQAESAGAEPEVLGTWINPHRTVKVATSYCAGGLCGSIVWAAPEAQADARDSGVADLIGTKLLRDYRATGPGRYEGTVYVPDMGRTFHSKIEQIDANSLKISGCIIGGLICKSQRWRRV
ncbi:MAG TPA: DUF2147 domain-containing protein [Xanthobacteraceae bacterium]|nr:DUF2147 domain-containing protein [Xanthobacteraceae bacterium]